MDDNEELYMTIDDLEFEISQLKDKLELVEKALNLSCRFDAEEVDFWLKLAKEMPSKKED